MKSTYLFFKLQFCKRNADLGELDLRWPGERQDKKKKHIEKNVKRIEKKRNKEIN